MKLYYNYSGLIVENEGKQSPIVSFPFKNYWVSLISLPIFARSLKSILISRTAFKQQLNFLTSRNQESHPAGAQRSQI